METAIYTLSGPDGVVRYVGQTKSPRRRIKAHVRDARRLQTRLHRWVSSLSAEPTMVIVEWVSDWDEAERRWVAKYLADGFDLVNGTPGGKDVEHVRRAGKRYPYTARAFRVIEGHRRPNSLVTPENMARAARTYDVFKAALKKAQKSGLADVVEARFKWLMTGGGGDTQPYESTRVFKNKRSRKGAA